MQKPNLRLLKTQSLQARSIRQRIALYLIYSFLAIYCFLMFSCSVHLPDADLCIANAPGQHLGCFNLKNDYEYVGPDIVLKAGAVKHYKPMTTIQDVSKFTCLDPDSWANAVTFLHQVQARCVCK